MLEYDIHPPPTFGDLLFWTMAYLPTAVVLVIILTHC